MQARGHWAHAAPPPIAWLTVLSAYSSTCYPSPLNPVFTFGASRHTRSSCRSPSRVTHIPCFPSFPTRHYRDVLLRNHFIRGLFLAHRMNHFMTAPLLEQTTHIKHAIRRPGIQLGSQGTLLVCSIARSASAHAYVRCTTLFFQYNTSFMRCIQSSNISFPPVSNTTSMPQQQSLLTHIPVDTSLQAQPNIQQFQCIVLHSLQLITHHMGKTLPCHPFPDIHAKRRHFKQLCSTWRLLN